MGLSNLNDGNVHKLRVERAKTIVLRKLLTNNYGINRKATDRHVQRQNTFGSITCWFERASYNV